MMTRSSLPALHREPCSTPPVGHAPERQRAEVFPPPICVVGMLMRVVSVTGGGDLREACYATEVSHLCLPFLASLDGLHGI